MIEILLKYIKNYLHNDLLTGTMTQEIQKLNWKIQGGSKPHKYK